MPHFTPQQRLGCNSQHFARDRKGYDVRLHPEMLWACLRHIEHKKYFCWVHFFSFLFQEIMMSDLQLNGGNPEFVRLKPIYFFVKNMFVVVRETTEN